jgi:hypothetical protein
MEEIVAITIPLTIPETIRIGDTVKFKRQHGDHLVDDSWVLTFYMVKDDGSKQLEWEATDNGDGYHLVTIAASGSPGTDDLLVGSWLFLERASKSGDAYTLSSGRIEVLPNLALAADLRSHAKKTLDALEATIEGRASSDQLSMSIGDRSISRMSMGELTSARDEYRAEVAREENAERIARGLGNTGKIRVRFQ